MTTKKPETEPIRIFAAEIHFQCPNCNSGFNRSISVKVGLQKYERKCPECGSTFEFEIEPISIKKWDYHLWKRGLNE